MRPPGTNEKDLEGARTPPESLDVILADLDNIRLPWRDLYRAYTEKPAAATTVIRRVNAEPAPVAVAHGPNRLERAKHEVDAGFNIHLTIDPDAQRIVQQRAPATRAIRRAASASAWSTMRSSTSSHG
jgi:hypothetical protein